MIIRSIKKSLFKLRIQNRLSKKRLRKIDFLYKKRLLSPQEKRQLVLDIGCQRGKDLITFLKDREDLHIIGLDLKDYGLRQNNFNLVIGDASYLPFAEDVFDISTSIGVFEHIVPIEELAKAVYEINRVSKSFLAVMPSINTIIEPHITQFFWQLKDKNKKKAYPGPGPLIHMSDEAWSAFSGFREAETLRYWHVPPFVCNLFIYKTPTDNLLWQKINQDN